MHLCTWKVRLDRGGALATRWPVELEAAPLDLFLSHAQAEAQNQAALLVTLLRARKPAVRCWYDMDAGIPVNGPLFMSQAATLRAHFHSNERVKANKSSLKAPSNTPNT
jgi:hypothetical protein